MNLDDFSIYTFNYGKTIASTSFIIIPYVAIGRISLNYGALFLFLFLLKRIILLVER